MKYFGLAALGLAMTVGASASTLTAFCGSFSASAGTGFFTSGSGVVASGPAITCTVQGLPAFSTFNSESVIVQTDYTGGLQGSSNSINTVFSSLVMTSDTITSSGVGGSTTYTSADGSPLYAAFTPAYYFTEPSTANNTASFVVNFSSTVTSGAVQGVSGQVYELISYTSAIPEPGSMMLLGSGLVAFALAGRKLVRK